MLIFKLSFTHVPLPTSKCSPNELTDPLSATESPLLAPLCWTHVVFDVVPQNGSIPP